MKILKAAARALHRILMLEVGYARPPDVVIGGAADPYLWRWFVIPRNPLFNVYLHRFFRSDDDRALHDHPWAWCSILLAGSYFEHTIAQGGIHHRTLRAAPSIRFSGAARAHRIELEQERDGPAVWTLFITGPRLRVWGFHCPERGWVRWQDFTSPSDRGVAGPGCDA